jgi:hypothetical protein
MAPRVKYKDERELEEVVKKFEHCEYGLAEFPHARHLTVAAWYLSRLPAAEAMAAMRRSLLRFTGHHKKQGYHETITRFWMELVAGFLSQDGMGRTLVESVNALLEEYSNKEIIFAYYSRDRVMSDEAKQEWLEPDVKPLPRAQLSA